MHTETKEVASSILYRKRVCVTGASGGLGRALSEAFVKEGCKLLLTSRNRDNLADLEAQLVDRYDAEIDLCVADLASDQGVDLVLEAMKDVGGVDVLINNAGVFPMAPIQETTRAEFDACFAINVRAPFLLAQGLIKESLSHGHGWGRIVNIGSSSAYSGFPNTSVYCGTKHALLGLSRSLFAELRGTGIQTYSVNPGSIKTPMGRRVPGQDFDTFLEPAEIAGFIVELLTKDGTMICEEVRLNRVVVR